MKTGKLTPEGARKLMRPDLANQTVEYTSRTNEGEEFANDIYHKGVRIGGIIIISNDGIIPQEEEE